MKRAILALVLVLLPATADAYECLPSSVAVFAAHPKALHASWEGRSQPGRKCWFAGYPGDQRPGKSIRATARPDGDMRRVTASGDGRQVDPVGNKSSVTGTNSQIEAHLREGIKTKATEAGGPTRPSLASTPLAFAAPIAAPPAPVAPAAPVLAPDSLEFALVLAKAKLVLADRLIQFQAQRRKEAAR